MTALSLHCCVESSEKKKLQWVWGSRKLCLEKGRTKFDEAWMVIKWSLSVDSKTRKVMCISFTVREHCLYCKKLSSMEVNSILFQSSNIFFFLMSIATVV